MFVVLQFPIIDARPFLQADTHRLSSPTWPLPQPSSEFIRSFGMVERRSNGGISDWPGEEFFCQAARALRFNQSFTQVKNLGGSKNKVSQYCAFRRFFADGGVVARLELGIGFRKKPYSFASLEESELHNFIDSILNQEVLVPSGNELHTTELGRAGQKLAEHYLQSSTQRDKGRLHPTEDWWVCSGTPLLLFEYEFDELRKLPENARHIQHPTLTVANICLSHVRRNLGTKKELSVWLLGYPPSSKKPGVLERLKRLGSLLHLERAVVDRDVFRRLRLNLLRLHVEQESITQVLRLIIDKKINIESGAEATERLQFYLNKATRLLSGQVRNGLPQSDILVVARHAENSTKEGYRTTLLAVLADIRPNLLRKIESYTNQINFYGAVDIMDNQQTFKGNIDGGVITAKTIEGSFNKAKTIEGSFNKAETIEGSFNKTDQFSNSQELEDELNKLTHAVEVMCKQLPEEERKKAKRSLEILEEEATSKSPRKEWYEISANGLIEAAKTVGEIADPVIKSTKAILDSLGGLPLPIV